MANYCGKCGSKLDDTTGLCPNCDKEQFEEVKPQTQKTQSKPNGAKRILKFLLALLLTILLLGGSIGALSYFDVINIPGMDKLFSNMGIQKRDRNSEDIDESSINYENYKVEPINAEEYLEENTKILDSWDVDTSTNIYTEQGIISMLKDRGFTSYPVTTEYTLSGDYISSLEVSEASSEKHPTYQTFYKNTSDEWWSIVVIDGSLIANPMSYNMQNSQGVQLVISETESVTSYDSATNKFYRTLPKESSLKLKVVGKIDTGTLDKLSVGELAK